MPTAKSFPQGDYDKRNLDLYIQKGFVKKHTKDAEKKPLNFLFNLSRWLKEEFIRYGIRFEDPCCPTEPTVEQSVVETLTATSGVLDPQTNTSYLTTTGAATYTLADGLPNTEKVIKMNADNGDVVVTVAHLNGGTTLTFGDAGDMVILRWVHNKWYISTNAGVVLA